MSIYVIEGGDGVGKTTLAKALSDRIGAVTIHCGYQSGWDIELMHTEVIELACTLSNDGQNVIIDRWALSELVYGTVFRDGASYNTKKLMNSYKDNVTFIYCRNDNAVENHKAMVSKRPEMFDDMTEVALLFDKLVRKSKLEWHTFDFNKVLTSKFINKVLRSAK